MILDTFDEDIGFLSDFAPDCIFEAFAGLDESRDRLVAAFRPTRLTAEQASIATSDEHDYRRVKIGRAHV